jgi:hypothetical protein
MIAVRWERRALDDRLVAGVDPEASFALRLRAAQITSERSRARLASGLHRVLEAAEEPPFTLSARAPLRRREILAARGVLEALARELRCDRAVRAQGVVRAQRLLTDVRGPLYLARSADNIERVARAARDSL